MDAFILQKIWLKTKIIKLAFFKRNQKFFQLFVIYLNFILNWLLNNFRNTGFYFLIFF